MTGIETWALALGLSMDCFAVSITSGIIWGRVRWKPMLLMAFFFGLFQALNPFFGWLGTRYFRYLIESVDHWIAFAILGFLGIRMIMESFKDEEEKHFNPASLKVILAMAVATSIDALATGIILPSVVGASTLLLMLTAVGLIGLTTFIISFAGVYIGKKFGDLFSSKAELLGGLVLIIIGCKILIEHLFLS